MNPIKMLSTLILLLNVCFLNAQEKELYIDYKLVTKQDLWKNRIELRANAQKCLSKKTRKLFLCAHGSDEVDTVYQYTHVYKDYQANEMKFHDDMPNSADVFVKEEMNLFNWQLCDEERQILGYNCQIAKTLFRGRNYIVWFTTELPFKAAPWKIHGLPGVVLQVMTEDDFLHIKARTIRIQEASEIINPYRKEKYMTWEEFKKIYLVKLKESSERNRRMLLAMGIEGKSGGLPREEVIAEYNRKGGVWGGTIWQDRMNED
jgi:GLPGLI family protein